MIVMVIMNPRKFKMKKYVNIGIPLPGAMPGRFKGSLHSFSILMSAIRRYARLINRQIKILSEDGTNQSTMINMATDPAVIHYCKNDICFTHSL